MKILHIVECFAGGVYDFIAELTNGLPQHEHTIIYGKRENTPLEFCSRFPEEVRFIPWSASREIRIKEDIKAFLDLTRIMRSLQYYDVIHLHSSKAGFLGRIAGKVLGKQDKIIYTPHGASFLRKDVSVSKRKFFAFLEKIGSLAGGKVVACSNSEASAFHRINIAASYVSNGIDINPYIYPKELKNNPSHVVIGTVGRITAPKNPSLFNKIAAYFVDNGNVEFTWIGDGELKSELSSPNINVTGWQTSSGVISELSKIDIYLSTSLWEGLPLAAVQAMASGLPLVASNCVGNVDIVNQNKNGYLYLEAEEAKRFLEMLIADADMRIKMGITSRKMAEEQFSLKSMIEGYTKQYQSILIKAN